MTKQSFFITGTDTEVGKTQVAAHFLRSAAERGASVAGIKALSAGLCAACSPHAHICFDQACTCDAHRLRQASSLKLSTQQAAPFVLQTPCSPNIAAQVDGTTLQAERIISRLRQIMLLAPESGWLIEGAGGWLTPINAQQTLADVAVGLQLPVVLVVGVRLGCINHALLSERVIAQSGGQLLGWVASEPEPAEYFEAQVQTLRAHLKAPLLHQIRFADRPQLDWPL